MNTRLLSALPLGLLLIAAPSSAKKPVEKPAVLSPEQYGELAKALKGREPGKPLRCIPMRGSSTSMRAISNELLVYREGSRVYATRVLGRCSGLAGGGALVTQPTAGRLCRGDIARVADTTDGSMAGACAMGDFIPYTKAKRQRD